MYNTGKKILICQIQNSKYNFPKFCNVYARQKSKTKPDAFTSALVETFALILNLKIIFKKLLWLKLSKLKKYSTCT